MNCQKNHLFPTKNVVKVTMLPFYDTTIAGTHVNTLVFKSEHSIVQQKCRTDETRCDLELWQLACRIVWRSGDQCRLGAIFAELCVFKYATLTQRRLRQ